jgi:hypothetical protein
MGLVGLRVLREARGGGHLGSQQVGTKAGLHEP